MVALSVASGKTVTVDYQTADDIATAPGDYAAVGGTLQYKVGHHLVALGMLECSIVLDYSES
jgi:hypothetical protein